jgi:hypothetical protein
MNIRRLIYFPNSDIIISIILGFGLATLFRQNCKNRQCLIFKGPHQKEILDKTFKIGNDCYKFTPENTPCNSSKKIIEFA